MEDTQGAAAPGRRLYRTILADPPWAESGGGKIKRGADKHYGLMKTKDIIELMRSVLEAPNVEIAEHAHLYLWVTNSFLKAGLEVMEALGFTYVTNVAWAKMHMGIGQYFRGKHELLLFGRRGKGLNESVCTAARDIPSCIVVEHDRDASGKRIHSRKPAVFHEMIEKRSKGPYLEMFARTARKGWDVWGNEAPTVIHEAAPPLDAIRLEFMDDDESECDDPACLSLLDHIDEMSLPTGAPVVDIIPMSPTDLARLSRVAETTHDRADFIAMVCEVDPAGEVTNVTRHDGTITSMRLATKYTPDDEEPTPAEFGL